MPRQKGFTLIELIIVIVILGILAVTAAPRFIDVSSDAKAAVLVNMKGAMTSQLKMVKAKAYIAGLSPAASNPGGNDQQAYVLDFGFGRTEVDWRNLCPESRAESGDAIGMLEFMDIDGDDFERQVDNRYSRIGYEIGGSSGAGQGCFLEYDSQGTPDCTIKVITTDC